MKAYVEIIQRKEREIGCDVLTHQKVRWEQLILSHALLKLFNSGVVRIMPTTLLRP